jgi:hypothetical protein
MTLAHTIFLCDIFMQSGWQTMDAASIQMLRRYHLEIKPSKQFDGLGWFTTKPRVAGELLLRETPMVYASVSEDRCFCCARRLPDKETVIEGPPVPAPASAAAAMDSLLPPGFMDAVLDRMKKSAQADADADPDKSTSLLRMLERVERERKERLALEASEADKSNKDRHPTQDKDEEGKDKHKTPHQGSQSAEKELAVQTKSKSQSEPGALVSDTVKTEAAKSSAAKAAPKVEATSTSGALKSKARRQQRKKKRAAAAVSASASDEKRPQAHAAVPAGKGEEQDKSSNGAANIVLRFIVVSA